MRNANLDEAQAGIKIARKNTNNLRSADDTTLMAVIDTDSMAMNLSKFQEIVKDREAWRVAVHAVKKSWT